MRSLEQYLLATGNQDIISRIHKGTEEARLFYSLSGETFKWVTLLRCADIHWTSKDAGDDSIALFRLREEGLIGDSPQISVRCSERYISQCFLLPSNRIADPDLHDFGLLHPESESAVKCGSLSKYLKTTV
jgi:hypothetical protein